MSVCYNKARGKWRFDFRLDGTRHQGYCDDPGTGKHATTKTEAKRIEAMVRGALIRQGANKPVEITSPATFTLSQAVAAFSARKMGGSNWANQKVYIQDLMTYFGPACPTATIAEDSADPNSPSIWGYIRWARQQPVMIYVGKGRPLAEMLELGTPIERLYRPTADGRTRSDSTINRYLDCLRAVLRIAYSLRDPNTGEMLFKGQMPKVPDLAEPEYMPRPFSDAEIWEAAERAPAHLAWGILLARLMGFRKAEMFDITISQVDFNLRGIWLAAADTKANRDEFVPANTEAMELLEYLVAEARARKVQHIITYRRVRTTWNIKDGTEASEHTPIRFGPAVPVKNPKKAFSRVLKEMGLEGVHTFHNTKASFVTAIAHVAPAAVTQDLARHRDYRTTQRYLKVADHAKRAAVEATTIQEKPHPSHSQEFLTGQKESRPEAAKSLKNLVGATGFEPATPSPPD
ncbi:tyrosine-type recombinase/integrase [Magnetospirillum molischianum]|uniref:Tyr recombinase domain-containing protein n=1 Tax=Magnetospirillum molischianum DSM 120 TaxID=1150626 RepID=H8FUW4_MAGML|nr:hypothetical protein PHAMO_340025 [Magnetospirillum molischianum DSM 120]